MKRVIVLFFATLACTAGFAQRAYEQLVRRAVTAMEADSLQLADSLLRAALQEEPAAASNVLLWGHLAGIAERTGREHEALEHYNKALGLAPKSVEMRLCRASLYLKLGNEVAALEDYNTILKANEDVTEALLMRAWIRQRQRLYKDARSDYEHVLRLEPMHERALQGLAIVNDNDRRPHEAMEIINRVIALYPKHAAGYALRAGMELKRGLKDLAEEDYNEAIRLEPDNTTYRLARAQLSVRGRGRRK